MNDMSSSFCMPILMLTSFVSSVVRMRDTKPLGRRKSQFQTKSNEDEEYSWSVPLPLKKTIDRRVFKIYLTVNISRQIPQVMY